MRPIKLRTKPIFQIFHTLKINKIMPFCNLFIDRPLRGHKNGTVAATEMASAAKPDACTKHIR